MTNKEKLIRIYNKALRKGKLECRGLCEELVVNNISNKKLLLFKPGKSISFSPSFNSYWASGFTIPTDKNWGKLRRTFTPLRQTILAFLIAMEE